MILSEGLPDPFGPLRPGVLQCVIVESEQAPDLDARYDSVDLFMLLFCMVWSLKSKCSLESRDCI